MRSHKDTEVVWSAGPFTKDVQYKRFSSLSYAPLKRQLLWRSRNRRGKMDSSTATLTCSSLSRQIASTNTKPEGKTLKPEANDWPVAKFESNLRLANTKQTLADPAKAIRHEFRDCSRWKRLHCQRVSLFSERDRGTVFVVQVGSSVEFDWTWEGAVAFKPRSIDGYEGLSDFALENTLHDDAVVWRERSLKSTSKMAVCS